MPVPKPKKGEEKSDFMARCMSALKEEYPDQDQRLAVCFDIWKRNPADAARSWFSIRDADEDEAEVYLYDEIGAWGTSASDFVEALRQVKAGVINLYVNSPGGDVFDGIAIHAVLQRHPAKVNAWVDGLAASSASFIVQAADRIVMSRNATMMIHEPYGLAIGNSETMAKMAETLGEVAETIASIYAERAGGESGEWRERMRAETWYRAQQAVDAGLADEVKAIKAPTQNWAPRFFNLSKFKNVPEWMKRVEVEPAQNAGRTMSQGNLDKLHSAMRSLDTVHEGTCDMAEDCPMEGRMAARSGPIRDEEWTAAYVNDLPDSAFAVILEGGEKDEDGKTVPRSLRKLPHHDKAGDVDVPHLRNALSREPQSDMPESAHTKARTHLRNHADEEGIGEGGEDTSIDEIIAAIERGLKGATEEVFGHV